MSKQDRQGARTASELVQRYNFGKSFAEVMGFATEAQEAAAEANASAKAASEAVNSLDQEEIFNRLTNNGQAQGIYRDPDTGELYINASYLATGVITSADGSIEIDLANNKFTIHTEYAAADGNTYKGKVCIENAGIKVYSWDKENNTYASGLRLSTAHICPEATQTVPHSTITGGKTALVLASNSGNPIQIGTMNNPVSIQNYDVSWKSNGDGTYTLVGTPAV